MTAMNVSPEQEAREAALMEQVVASFAHAPPRLSELMKCLTRHLHDVVRETRVTEEEWGQAIGFLTEAGRITDERRQEFILLSDVLGLSMQVIAVNNEAFEDATESTVFGPFFTEGSPRIEQGGDIAGGASGQPCWVEGSVTSTDGTQIADALIEVWEADDEGFYDVQRPDGRVAGRGHLRSDGDGQFRFWALTPTPYPIPDDGPVGAMLKAVGRSPLRASHLHFMVTAPGHRTLVTHIFRHGDPIGYGDSVFGVKESLIKHFSEHGASVPTPDGRVVSSTWTSTRFDIVLAPDR